MWSQISVTTRNVVTDNDHYNVVTDNDHYSVVTDNDHYNVVTDKCDHKNVVTDKCDHYNVVTDNLLDSDQFYGHLVVIKLWLLMWSSCGLSDHILWSVNL